MTGCLDSRMQGPNAWMPRFRLGKRCGMDAVGPAIPTANGGGLKMVDSQIELHRCAIQCLLATRDESCTRLDENEGGHMCISQRL